MRNIGRGCLGLEAFRRLLNDRRFAKVPMHLETAKEQENGEEMDVVNLRTLRSLVEQCTGAGSSRSTVTRGSN
jgi:deoxyribonuclease-4